MPKHRLRQPDAMIDRIALALAKRGGEADRGRYQRLAMASVKTMVVPREAMIDAAHAAIWFDDGWAVVDHRDFRPVVRAMITHAIAEGCDALSANGSLARLQFLGACHGRLHWGGLAPPAVT